MKGGKIRNTIKIVTFLGASVMLSNRVEQFNLGFNRKKQFKQNMRLCFPHFEYKEVKDNQNYAQIVS